VFFDVLQANVHPSDPVKAAALERAGLVANLKRLLDGARTAGLTIFYARADHSPDQADIVPRLTDTDFDLKPWPDPSQPFMRVMTRDRPESRIADEVTPRDGEGVLVLKHRASAFFQTHLELALRARGLDTIILAGLSTDVGIAATAFTARDLDIAMVIVRDACFAHRGPNHDFLMDRIFPRMARIRTTEETIALMNSRPTGE
jgi:nicotinamidase-related amidase